MSFICRHHRQLFSQHPTHAKKVWQSGMRQTLVLYDATRYGEAVPHIGSCYDISLLLIELNNRPHDPELDNYKRLSLSIYGLSKCLRALGEKQAERHFLLEVHYLLVNEGEQRESSGIEFQRAYQTSVQMLKKHYQFYGEVNPFEPSSRFFDQSLDKNCRPLHRMAEDTHH